MKQALKRRSISLTDEQWQALCELAEKEFDGNVSIMIRTILRKFLKKHAKI